MDRQPEIERLIGQWRQQIRKQDFLEDGVIAELEDHLRQSIDKQMGSGASAQEAFDKAIEDLGSPYDINQEERAVQFRYSQSPWPLVESYIRIALRNIRRKKFISSINVVGLSLGVAISLLLGVYAWDIITYDQFHENTEDIYFLYRTRLTPEGGNLDVSDTYAPLADEVKKAFPQVKHVTRFAFFGRGLMRVGDQEFREEITYSDQGMFDMFSFPLAKGVASEVFKNPNSIVISEEVAQRMFGDEDPIGQTVQMDLNETLTYEVTGVLGKVPFNSSFQFDVIINVESRKAFWTERGFWGWNASFMWSFVQLEKGQDPEELVAQFPAIAEKFISESERGTLELLPLAEYFDYNTNQQTYGYLLGYIAIGLLLIAFFNFANLNAAQSLVRFKEVAVRKVFGAGRGDLVQQFIGETALLFTLSAVLGVGLGFLLLPYFIGLFEQQMSLSFLLEPLSIVMLLVAIVALGALAGLYPTLRLSKLRSGDAMHGSWSKGKRGFDPKNILVSLQFAIAIMLISAVVIMYRQISFMKTADMNFDPDNVMIIEASGGREEEGQQRLTAFRNALESLAGVEKVSATSSVPGRYRGSYVLVQSDDARDKPPLDWRFVDVDHEYFKSLDIEFVDGRDFDIDMSSDERKSVINEAAMEQLGWSSVEGRKLMFPEEDEGFDVIGVVKDFNYQSLVNRVEPVIHVFRGRTSGRYEMLAVRLTGGDISETIGQIEAAWNDFDSSRPMEYSFLDENFKTLYENEERIGEMTLYATIMAIFVAVLGILGLASFNVIERMKEMAIRKVLGASVRQLLLLLLKHTTILLTIGLVIAIPINFMVMSDWLEDFAFRISLDAWTYLLATLIVLVTAWVVLGAYSLRAVKANPAGTLRNE